MRISKLLSILFLLSLFSYAQTAPAPPSNLQLTIGGQNSSVQAVMLTWDYAQVSGNIKFDVYKKPGLIADTSHPFQKIATVTQKSFVDPGVRLGDKFSYYVTAVLGNAQSIPSNLVDGELNPPVIAIGKINGHLYADSLLVPIPMGTIEIFPAALSTIGDGVDIRTDSLGNFSVKLPVGDYFIWSSAKNFAPEYFDNAATLKNATKISLKENDSLVFSIGLAPLAPPPPPPATGNAKISGKLFDDSTLVPIPRGNVQLFPAQITANCGPGINLFTDSLGNFSGKLKAGQYYMYSSAPGYFGEYYDNVKTLQLATKITLNAGDSLVYSIGLARIVPPVTYSVSGWVKDESGNPQKADLTAYIVNRQHSPSCWEMSYSARTDSLGNYKFNKVKPNDTLVIFIKPLDHKLLAQYYNGKTKFNDADRIPVTGNVTGINVTLAAKPIYTNGISGNVMDSAGVTVVAGRVFIYEKLNGRLGFRGMVNTDTLTGDYSFTNLEPGQYFLLAEGPGYKPSYFRYDGASTFNWRLADSIAVTESSLISGIDFRLLAHAPHTGGGFVFGNIIGSDGSTLPGALNYVVDSNNNLLDYSVSDMDGSYIIGNLGAGAYTLVSTLVNFNDNQNSLSVDYQTNSTLNVNVNMTPNAATGINDYSSIINGYALNQNYPNPFNPSTIISYQIQQSGLVTLKLYNILGKEVATLVNENKSAGKYSYNLNAGNLASGVYFYKLQSGNFISIKKMTLLK